jgi:type II secretory pathway pseudopilin PulG
LLVVLAILAVLISLLLPAVQAVRESAINIYAQNQVRQILLGMTNFADTHGQLPCIRGRDPNPDLPPFCAILPYIEQEALFRKITSYYGNQPDSSGYEIPSFVNPMDPDQNPIDRGLGRVSYAYNAQILNRDHRALPHVCPDGTSNTLLIAEHYRACERAGFFWFDKENWYDSKDTYSRRASFADGGPEVLRSVYPDFLDGYQDVHPVIDRARGQTTSSLAGKTFQVRPRLAECNPRQPQTPFRNAMLGGLLDGSVRSIAKAISPGTFWSAVTPDGGEVLGAEW